MIREVVVLIMVLLYSGCSSKNESKMRKSFKEEISFNSKLQKSEKLRLYDEGEVKILFTATYLNGEQSLDAENDNQKINEEFIVGLYQSDADQLGLKSREQNLTLDGKLPAKVRKLSQSDPLLKNIPMANAWSSYYHVSFPHTGKKIFNLTFENDLYGKGELKFAKRAKFLLIRPTF
ncbi:MAG: hypothetical protein U9Q90_03905 [Campylobacterota bacterium]|nr:hypothetical protein [Campylobacterota bacterium]